MSVTHLSAPNIMGTPWNIDAGTYQHWRAMSQNAKGRRRWLRRHKREEYRQGLRASKAQAWDGT